MGFFFFFFFSPYGYLEVNIHSCLVLSYGGDKVWAFDSEERSAEMGVLVVLWHRLLVPGVPLHSAALVAPAEVGLWLLPKFLVRNLLTDCVTEMCSVWARISETHEEAWRVTTRFGPSCAWCPLYRCLSHSTTALCPFLQAPAWPFGRRVLSFCEVNHYRGAISS